MADNQLNGPGPCPVAQGMRSRAAVTILNVALAICLMLMASCKGRHNADMAVCGDNLKRIDMALKMYSADHEGMYPPLSPQIGVLMFTPEAVPPKNFSGKLPLTCPTIRYGSGPISANLTGDLPESAYDDQSYFYLGYAVLDDDDVEAFAEAYRKQIAAGETFEDDLVVESDGETRVLHRLSENVKEAWRSTQDPHAVSPYEGREEYYRLPGVIIADVPVLIERTSVHVYTDRDGRPRGANVVYLNAGLQFVEPGTWPMTEKTQRILAELGDQ